MSANTCSAVRRTLDAFSCVSSILLLKVSVYFSYLSLEWTQVRYIQVFIKYLGIFQNENFNGLSINNVVVCGMDINDPFLNLISSLYSHG